MYTTQMSINWWMGKQNMMYPYNEIVFNYKKEWSTDAYHNMDEPWKHAKWKKSFIRDHVLYDSLCKNILKREQ